MFRKVDPVRPIGTKIHTGTQLDTTNKPVKAFFENGQKSASWFMDVPLIYTNVISWMMTSFELNCPTVRIIII